MTESVYFFGGLNATKAQMDIWVATAQGQQKHIDFTAYFWAEGNKEDKAVAAIKASKADRIFIVGHSSGCANANAVDKKVVDKSLVDRVVLVALDGFYPDGNQRGRPSTQLWGAESGGNISLHFNTMRNMGGGKFQSFPAKSDCTKVWPLHFSLVNSNATDSIVKDPPGYIQTGYAQCMANLCWWELLRRKNIAPPPRGVCIPA